MRSGTLYKLLKQIKHVIYYKYFYIYIFLFVPISSISVFASGWQSSEMFVGAGGQSSRSGTDTKAITALQTKINRIN